MTDTTETDRKRGSGARLVYDTLRDEILSLTLAPGETIDEAALAEAYQAVCRMAEELTAQGKARGWV